MKRLSNLETIIWRLGQDSTLRMTIGALVVLDEVPSTEALEQRLDDAAGREPLLRQRPDDLASGWSRPVWLDEADIAHVDATNRTRWNVHKHHLRHLSLAAPGSPRQLLDLVALLESVPFDPERSPWDVTVVDGVNGNKAALYVRAHHLLTDGLGGVRLLALLLDERVAKADPPVAAPPVAAGRRPARPMALLAASRSGTWTLTLDVNAAARRVSETVTAARGAAHEVAPTDSAARGVQRALEVANSLSRQLMVTGGPLSPWPDSRSLFSRFETFSVPGARSVALGLGGSRNDLLVAAAAAGIGRYQERMGQTVSELRVATPTTQRHAGERGGNWFAPTRVEVPSTYGHPGRQFGAVAERLAQVRREPVLAVTGVLAAAIARLPGRVLVPAMQAQADSVDFAATALSGMRTEARLCGARVEAVYPFAPRLGCPLNITAFGNEDRLDVGLALDESAVADPDLLLECLQDAFGTFARAAATGDPE